MRDGGTGNVLVLITILLIRQLSSREIVAEGLESSHEGEATTGDDARAGDEDESGDGRGGANDEGGDDGENTT